MDRNEALALVKERSTNKNIVKHMLATEAVMEALATKFGEDIAKWGIAGLLHDLDYDLTFKDRPNHGKLTAEWLDGKVDADIIHAIKGHCDQAPRVSRMDKALYAVDPLTGFIAACALIHPDKKLSSIDVPFILKRIDEKRFAAGADRPQMKSCTDIGLTLEEFITIGLSAMQSISNELGL